MKKIILSAFAICALTTYTIAQDVTVEANPMLSNALLFLNTPYAANTLDVTNNEELIVNADEVDCTTFVEYVLAMALCDEQGDDMMESDFATNLEKIRYRNGKIDGYTSRLHYITEWVSDNIKKGTIEDVTASKSKDVIPVFVNYMSTHPDRYKHLANSPENVAKMSQIEKQISGQKVSYIPKEKLPQDGFPWIKNGDIIAFTTNTSGLDISHMGIAIYLKGNLHLIHASSRDKKVIVDQVALYKQLDRDKHITGIRVLRMKK
ncbi:N-acetylmuramoyl-L-alanine amidase-like domain-containing protein [Bacteroides sp. 519]|uniref:N-acetylmuramoyl-L-alanine amidase-like domain-containing protein n=1 Tax=Bacteroides sp. 519 TaxID=2302937 RepID=UPI0013D524DA|nr:N-acetylmuramoyl-L-alanine amidase-like domain-containing protein [Bacteroides sp. 519]NDV60178.1 DUF1460 domain-containing protein [Bacteroides sp. 519]